MADRSDPPPSQATREQRLAARLRENLHRRKAQARSLARMEDAATPVDHPDSHGLPKSRPES
ncbi:hypothetical protein [Novosphingobium colocasiae]|uniref:Uncharacterized protein n=1 Tax=Novosphingobium colocasiae TaxID=1256513 RepID=A0A918P8D6_9SPHN|nr:hypothetical protein [Novosphingobium colocasiae]GGY89815.1 hypothetical protein GCM10011614_00360 [Novosphingobium colocasiae]